MKRFAAILLALLLCAAAFPAGAQEMATYSDAVYSFQYPASWKRGTANDGSIVLEISSQSAILTFAIINDLVTFTGDEETDAPLIENQITQYSGKSLSLDGSYELLTVGEMHGFRAFGKWAKKMPAEMIYLSDGAHLMCFVFAGEAAIAAEGDLLSTVVPQGGLGAGDSGKAGYALWQGKGYSLLYPEGYGVMEQNTGVVFMNAESKDNFIMARTYSLDQNYTDALAPLIAQTYLPKSTKVEAAAEMTEIAGRKVALIAGDSASGPLRFYVLGSGRTALALLIIGENAISYAEDVVASVTFE